MNVITTLDELRAMLAPSPQRASSTPPEGPRGLVPTMGALHEGHLALVRQCKQRCQTTIVSIFVNPTQFAPHEDLTKYPRTLESDIDRLASENVDFVFVPLATEMYPVACTTAVLPPAVAECWEGEHRPAHYRGVATVVLKLLHLTQPDLAFFGQKDYQQSLVIRHMVRDLNLPVTIEVCPIVRDDDGLALSSRNRFLTEEQRIIARSLNQTLQQTAQAIEDGETDGHVLQASMTQSLIEAGVDQVDYALAVNAESLKILDFVEGSVALLVAAHVGKTRLIDNIVLNTQ